ncbi:MAG: glycoside hydrolase [Bacteroidota bacterium]
MRRWNWCLIRCGKEQPEREKGGEDLRNRKESRRWRLLLLVLGLVSLSVLPSPVHAGSLIKIHPGQEYQTMEGFGTSLAWWANVVGGWQDCDKKQHILDLLFTASSGIGLNTVRYNIGGGENPGHEHMRVGAEIPGYQPSPGVWDWNADAGQRWILQEAINRGATRLEAFSNAPPYWMTNSNCAAGSLLGGNNLKDDMYDDFAEYLTAVVKFFKDYRGVTFDTLSIFNEPVSPWWISSNNQEGCHFDRDKQNLLISEVQSRLTAKNLSTKISVPEEYSVNDTIDSFNSYDSTAKSHVYQLNTHSYSGDKRAMLMNLAAEHGKKLWMSEAGAGVGSHDHAAIDSSLSLANLIRMDLKELQPTVWCYWQAVEDEDRAVAYDHNWGLIHATFSSGEDYYVTKQYYAMGNYSKFIRPGCKIIGLDDGGNISLAAYDRASGTLVIVTTNDTASDMSITYDLTEFTSVFGSVTPYRTSAAENLAPLAAIPVTNKTFTATARAKSITTYVIGNAVYDGPRNYAGNGNFDYSGTAMSSWAAGGYAGSNYLEAGGRTGNRLAHYSAVYYQAYTYQIITDIPNGNYSLSAWVKSSGGQNAAQMQVKNYGGPKINHNIPASSEWVEITIPNINVSSNRIEIAFWSDSPGGKWINVDDVVLELADPLGGENLLANSGFETGVLAPWRAEWNASLAGVETNYPYEGHYDAYLHPNVFQDVAVYQTVAAPAARKYTLEASCATDISNGVWIGVDVNGREVGDTYINNGGAYEKYVIEFDAPAGASIKIWYYAARASGWGTIDAAKLY